MGSVSALTAVETDRVHGPLVRLVIFPSGRLKRCHICCKWKPEITFPFHVYRKTLRSKCTCCQRCTVFLSEKNAAYRATEDGKASQRRADQKDQRKQLRGDRDRSAWGKAVKKQKNTALYADPMRKAMCKLQTRVLALHVQTSRSKTIKRWLGPNAQTPLARLVKSKPLLQLDHKIAIFWYLWKIEDDKLVRLENVDVRALRRCWSIDNLQMITAAENQEKAYSLLPDEGLLELRHCWPVWWGDKLPTKQIRAMSKGAKEYDLVSCSESESESGCESGLSE